LLLVTLLTTTDPTTIVMTMYYYTLLSYHRGLSHSPPPVLLHASSIPPRFVPLSPPSPLSHFNHYIATRSFLSLSRARAHTRTHNLSRTEATTSPVCVCGWVGGWVGGGGGGWWSLTCLWSGAHAYTCISCVSVRER
jgi:hypothetical protein